MIDLHPMTDADFAWLLGEAPAHRAGLILPDIAIAPPEIPTMLRAITADIASVEDRPVAWLVGDDGTATAMISFTRRGGDGRYELGYGVAPAHPGAGGYDARSGHFAAAFGGARPSWLDRGDQRRQSRAQRVLERNGFVRTGTREDPEDGALITWAIDLI